MATSRDLVNHLTNLSLGVKGRFAWNLKPFYKNVFGNDIQYLIGDHYKKISAWQIKSLSFDDLWHAVATGVLISPEFKLVFAAWDAYKNVPCRVGKGFSMALSSMHQKSTLPR